jgi:outer membrane receptor for Fe3+-dicitrate
MHTALRRSFVVAALLAAGTAPLQSQVQPAADDAAVDSLPADTVTSPVHRIPELTVVGDSRAALHRVPGSAAVLTRTDIRDMVRISGNEVLRTVPGVHVVEEEGAGMRANIGIRGLDPGRSRTVLILEDGVPVALAPYGEPEMYYTPPVDRMERIEVVKGSGSILFGPQTIGGVINYVTPAPPANPQASVELRAGNGGLGHLDARYGGRWGGVGAHVGVLHKRAADLRGLFYNITDVTGKTAFALSDRSDLTLKASAYDEDSNSTYVGLSEPMYRANPNHPSLAQEDRLDVRRYSVSAATSTGSLPRWRCRRPPTLPTLYGTGTGRTSRCRTARWSSVTPSARGTGPSSSAALSRGFGGTTRSSEWTANWMPASASTGNRRVIRE